MEALKIIVRERREEYPTEAHEKIWSYFGEISCALYNMSVAKNRVEGKEIAAKELGYETAQDFYAAFKDQPVPEEVIERLKNLKIATSHAHREFAKRLH